MLSGGFDLTGDVAWQLAVRRPAPGEMDDRELLSDSRIFPLI
jgi:hypothetical protein